MCAIGLCVDKLKVSKVSIEARVNQIICLDEV